MGMASSAEGVSTPPVPNPGETVAVRSRRFGSFDVAREQILEFPAGLIGFPRGRRYVILEHRPGSPFKWLLSIDDPELAFAVADPCELVAGYQPPIEPAAKLLGVVPGDVALFVIVTIPRDPKNMTVNLMAPVVVDTQTRRARQMVIEDQNLSPCHPVVPAS
jgi:flagellar assembly factor FliW